MVTSRLDNIYLQAKLLNITDVKAFLQDALDPPSSEAIEHAERFLYDIGALVSHTNELTPMGRILAQYVRRKDHSEKLCPPSLVCPWHRKLESS